MSNSNNYKIGPRWVYPVNRYLYLHKIIEKKTKTKTTKLVTSVHCIFFIDGGEGAESVVREIYEVADGRSIVELMNQGLLLNPKRFQLACGSNY